MNVYFNEASGGEAASAAVKERGSWIAHGQSAALAHVDYPQGLLLLLSWRIALQCRPYELAGSRRFGDAVAMIRGLPVKGYLRDTFSSSDMLCRSLCAPCRAYGLGKHVPTRLFSGC